MNDRDLGEMIGTVRGMAERLKGLEDANREGFRQTQDRIEQTRARLDEKTDAINARLDERAKVWEDRFRTLEGFRYWILGGLGILTILYAAGLVWLGGVFQR